MAVASAAALIVVAPLLVGGGPGWAQVLCSALSLAVTVAFVVSRRGDVRLAPFAIVALVATAMTLGQLAPVPKLLVRLLSPHAHDLRAETSTQWLMPLTLDVPATVLEAVKAFACLGLIVAVSMSARRAGRVRPIVLALAFVGPMVVLVHAVQRALGARHILGFYRVIELPDSSFFGTFVNVNHAAALLTLSTLAAAGLALESDGLLRKVAIGSAVLCSAGIFSTGSRSGVLGLTAGAVALTGLRLTRRLGALRGTLLGLGIVAGLGIGALSINDSLRGRLANFVTAPATEQKVRGWRDTLSLAADYPWTGVGRGAYESPMTSHRRSTEGVRLAYPENVVLQTVTDWGVPAALLLLLLATVAVRSVLPAVPRLEPSLQGITCGLGALLVHDLGDFSLAVAGVAIPASIALGVVVGRSGERLDPNRTQSPHVPVPPVIAALAGWVLVLAAGIWALPHVLQREGARLRGALADRAPDAGAQISVAIARHPADYYLEVLAASEAIRRKDVTAGRHLNRALRLDPGDGRLHQMTARWLSGNGHPGQAALEYRLAAEAGVFTPFTELMTAVGPRRLGEAVPATGGWLMQTAGELLARGRAADAREVSRRAMEVGGGDETVSRQRVELAMRSQVVPFTAEAARDLLTVASEPMSYAEAAEALARIGEADAGDRAIESGLANHPDDGTLILTGTRLKLARPDLEGAVAILKRADGGTYSLRERMQLEDLRARIAERRGEAATAAALHARARTLERMATDQQAAGGL
jgi:hypothetical protein